MYILGINAFHGDSSACIFQDDRFIAALEEERLTRIKHWAGLPVQAIPVLLVRKPAAPWAMSITSQSLVIPKQIFPIKCSMR